eukprot:scaffold19183_cov112-Isochrysis_galbana.AAC.1
MLRLRGRRVNTIKADWLHLAVAEQRDLDERWCRWRRCGAGLAVRRTGTANLAHPVVSHCDGD